MGLYVELPYCIQQNIVSNHHGQVTLSVKAKQWSQLRLIGTDILTILCRFGQYSLSWPRYGRSYNDVCAMCRCVVESPATRECEFWQKAANCSIILESALYEKWQLKWKCKMRWPNNMGQQRRKARCITGLHVSDPQKELHRCLFGWDFSTLPY